MSNQPPSEPHHDEPHGAIDLAALYVMNELDAPTREAVERMAREDSTLRTRIATLRSACDSLRLLATHDAALTLAPAARARLASLMPGKRTAAPNALTRAIASAKDVLALLLADSSRGEVPAGLRSGMQAAIRTLRYDCEQGELLLRIEPQPDGVTVLVLGQADTQLNGETVQLFDADLGDELASCPVAEDGYFECVVPMRHCTLQLTTSSNLTITIPQLPLDQAGGAPSTSS